MTKPLDGLLTGIKNITRDGTLVATAGRDSTLDFDTTFTASLNAETEVISLGVDLTAIDTVTATDAGLAPAPESATGLTLMSGHNGTPRWARPQSVYAMAPRNIILDGWEYDDTQDGCLKQTDVSAAKELIFPLAVQTGSIIYELSAWITGAAHTDVADTRAALYLEKRDIAASGLGSWTLVTDWEDNYSTETAALPRKRDSVTFYHTVTENTMYRIRITGETGTNSVAGLTVLDLLVNVIQNGGADR